MFVEWALANKATYVGARAAIVSDPVAPDLTNPLVVFTSDQLSHLGAGCLNESNGDATGSCPGPGLTVVCTSTGCNCTAGCDEPTQFGFSPDAFTNLAGTGIFDRMKIIFTRLQPENVTVTYELNGVGFVGNPNGLPMNVTVSIVGMTHQLFFLPSILSFFGSTVSSSWGLPAFATTLTSEDLATN
jgi:hypothetical protein